MAKPLSDVRILPLSRCPEHLAQVAAWINAERALAGLNGSEADSAERLAGHLGEEPVPLTIVALLAGRPIGAASLVFYQFTAGKSSRADDSPWLSNVYVQAEYRQRGLGSQLVAFLEQYARDQAYGKIKLFTADKQGFYLRRNWSLEYVARLGGRDVDVMSLDLGLA